MSEHRSQKTVIVFRNPKGNEPFTDWLRKIRDPASRRRILKRILRLEQGYYGDTKPVGKGVFELRFFIGPGYWIYFAEDGEKIIVLLCGGDKKSQSRDIRKAQQYYQEYQTHE